VIPYPSSPRGPGDRQPDSTRTTGDQRCLLRQRLLLYGLANSGRHPIGGPSTMAAPCHGKPSTAAARAAARSRACRRAAAARTTAPAAAATRRPASVRVSPSAQGKTPAPGPDDREGRPGNRWFSPAAGYFHLGTNRFPLRRLHPRPASRSTDANRRAPTAAPGRGVDGPAIGSLPGADRGPHHPRPPSRPRTTSDDPSAAQGRIRHGHPIRQAGPLGSFGAPDQGAAAPSQYSLLPSPNPRSATTRCRRFGPEERQPSTP